MQVRGLTIPSAYVDLIDRGELPLSLELIQDCDYWGNEFIEDIDGFYTTTQQMEEETDSFANCFLKLDPQEGTESEPGFIDYIMDYSKIVAFAMSGEGYPYCFDFRTNAAEPSIIFRDGGYWRLVAPTFTDFIELFEEEREDES